MRDVVFLAGLADQHGEAVGRYARALLAGRQPWSRMRQVRKLLQLAKKYGDARACEACTTALAVDLVDIYRLERILQLAKVAAPEHPARVIPIARYLRPARSYKLRPPNNEGETE